MQNDIINYINDELKHKDKVVVCLIEEKGFTENVVKDIVLSFLDTSYIVEMDKQANFYLLMVERKPLLVTNN